MLKRLLRLLVVLVLLTSGSVDFGSTRAQVNPSAYLPDSLFLAHADCFRIDDEGILDFSSLLTRFAQVPDAAAQLTALGWEAGAYRQFGCDQPPAGSAGFIDLGVYLFATPDGATAAAPFFADSRALGTALQRVPGQTALTGPAVNGTEYTLYLVYDKVLFRITGVAPVGSPEADVTQVGISLLAGAAIVAGRESTANDDGSATKSASGFAYDIVDLGAGGGNYSTATAINDANMVLWYWGEAQSPDEISPRLNETVLVLSGPDSAVDLATTGTNYGLALNDAGTVLGQSGREYFVYEDDAGQSLSLSDLPDGVFLNDLNNTGMILGHAQLQALLLENGRVQSLPIPVGYEGVHAGGLNDLDQVAGTAYRDGPLGEQRAVFIAGNEVTVLSPAPGALGSTGFDVNNAGLVIGGAERKGARAMLMYGRGFVYDSKALRMTDIGTLGAYPNSAPTAINEVGQVVGYLWGGEAGINEPDPFNAAFIYDYRTDTLTDLNTLIDPNSGWVLYRAYDINDAGLIVGQGMYNGGMRAFILVPR